MSWSVGAIILARMSSTRFPGKALASVNGCSLLVNIHRRIRTQLPDLEVVVATSCHPSDDRIVDECLKHGVCHFRGALEDVSRRCLQVADTFGFDYFVRVNGDNLFGDSSVLKSALKVAKMGRYELVTNVPQRTYPKGMSVEILNTNFFQNVYATMHSEQEKEHVTSKIYENLPGIDVFQFFNEEYPDVAGLQLAVDTKKDLELLKKIIEFSGKEIWDIGIAEVSSFINRKSKK